MYWILLVVFPASVLSIVVDSRADCEALNRINQAHWQQSGQLAMSVCMKSFEV